MVLTGMKASVSILLLVFVFGTTIARQTPNHVDKILRRARRQACGGSVSGASSEIQLPTTDVNGTQFYSVNQRCEWQVTVPAGNHALITSDYFSIELSDNCDWDYVEIKESSTGRTTRFCGWETLVYVTVDNDVTITFVSDDSYEDRGFKLAISAIPDSPTLSCNSTFYPTVGSSGHFENSEGSGSTCFYAIIAPAGYSIRLEVKFFNFGSQSCAEESLVFKDGISSHGREVWQLCSGDPRDREPVMTEAFIEYRNAAGNEGDRYRIDYTVAETSTATTSAPVTVKSPVGGNNDCSGQIQDKDATFIAPEYQNNKECIIVARTTFPGHVIQMEFEYFDIEESDNCMFDSLRLYAGERNGSAEMGGPYCGESLQGKTLLSQGNSIRMVFKTDESFVLKGMKVKLSFKPAGCFCKNTNNICIRKGYEKICIDQTRECAVNVCENGGTCVKEGGKEKCYCAPGFSGNTCTESKAGGHIWFTKFIKSKNLEKGRTHLEHCEAKTDSGILPLYTWYFNGAPLPDYTPRNGIGSKAHSKNVLQIDNFRGSLEGDYTCEARVDDVSVEYTARFTEVQECSVRISQGPKDGVYKTGENAVLGCPYEGSASDFKWQKDGQDIMEDNNRYSLTGLYLLINDMDTADAGQYRCVVTDQAGCSVHREATLTVLKVKKHNEYCGISKTQSEASAMIVKGTDAIMFNNPWHVTMYAKRIGKAFCGATVISRNYIVTAAHCINDYKERTQKDMIPNDVQFLFGSLSCSAAAVIRSFKNIIIHDRYNNVTYDYDIALIELDRPIKYSEAVRPICLEPDTFINVDFFQRQLSSGRVVGCGQYKAAATKTDAPEVLQSIVLPYADRDDCAENLDELAKDYNLTESMICAGFKTRNRGDVCYGDSGGGYIMNSSQNRWVLVGIVSWGVGRRCDNEHYTMFSNVGHMYEWIKQIAKPHLEEVKEGEMDREIVD